MKFAKFSNSTMGSGTSAGLSKAIERATIEELSETLAGLSDDTASKLRNSVMKELDDLEVCVAAQVLTVFDFFAGNQLWRPSDTARASHLQGLGSDMSSVDGERVCVLDLTSCCDLHLRFLSKVRYGVEPALAKLGLELRATSDGLLLCRFGTEQPLNMGALVEVVLKVEATMVKDLSDLAELMENSASRALRCCAELTKESGVLTGFDLTELDKFQMAPVEAYDHTIYGGSVGEVLGPGGLAAMTGFCTYASEAKITMPNFLQWSEDSEFVQYRLRFVDEALPRPIGRLWRSMLVECIRAPCHEVIHLLQHVTGQRMNGQVAEHDGYFSSCILTAACLHRDPSVGFPGVVELALLIDIARISRVLEIKPDHWDVELYQKWRDSFGAGTGLWNDNNFNGHDGKGTEFLVGSTLTFEAACIDGSFIDDADPDQLAPVVDAMLRTMFEGRTKLHPDAMFDEKRQEAYLECTGRAVNIREPVRLAGLSLVERLRRATAEVGRDRAADFAKKWAAA